MRISFTPSQSETQSWPEIWQATYRILEQNVVSNQLQAWIQPLRFIETETSEAGLKVRMAAPNDFSAQWVRDQYRKSIEQALTQVTGLNCELLLTVQESIAQPSDHYEPPTASVAHNYSSQYSSHHVHQGSGNVSSGNPSFGGDFAPTGGVVVSSGSRAKPLESALDNRYTLESFVVGASNQFAYASAVAVSEQPARQYNPLFLYSPPGLGKTHLLHAIGNQLIAKNPGARVVYLSAEAFVNELIDSLQHRRMPQFRAKYRDSYDMILIDDIQFIAGKTTSEEEFFHTFNALHSSKRQIVLTSDRPPKEIQGLEERIRTRFEWGLIADITVPEIETRIAILKAKAEREDIYLPDDVATFLASHIKTNVRELEGVLIRLQAQASLTGAEISLEMAKHELRASIPEESPHLTVEAILAAVAKHFRLKAQDFKSTSRARAVAVPRQIAMFLIRKYTGIGFKEIGVYFGGKDHTTIMHACSKIEEGLETDRSTREAVEAIQNLL
jgi:chromosomal replication initiator protein